MTANFDPRGSRAKERTGSEAVLVGVACVKSLQV